VGGIFFGSADGQILWFRDDVVSDIRLPEGLPSGGVQAITADSSGAVYVLNGSYLLRMDRSLDVVTVERSEPVVVSFAVSPQGELWTATRWGIYRRGEAGYAGVNVHLSERQPVFSAIGFDERGSLWVGTQAGNVHRYDGQIWMRMGDAGDLNLGAIRALVSDGEGRLWVTGSNGGVAAYHYGRWLTFGPPAYGERPAVQIAVAPNGVPVLATDTGLWGFGGSGSWAPVGADGPAAAADTTHPAVWDAGAPQILCLGFEPSGRIFVGTEDGVAAIDKTGTRWITYRRGLGGSAVTSILAQRNGDVWVGFRADGLTRLRFGATPVGPDRD
jgi:ligand-binding sensor domain-containing protein